MKKGTKVVLATIMLLSVMISFVGCGTKKEENKEVKNENVQTSLGTINSAEDLTKIIENVYANVEEGVLPQVETMEIETSDDDMVNSLTGLENGKELEFMVISQPLMNAQAYSFVLAKVKDGVSASSVAEKMCNQVNTRRWICVEADKVYATSSGNVVCLIMGDEDAVNNVFGSFSVRAGTIGERYEKESEQIELEPDMF